MVKEPGPAKDGAMPIRAVIVATLLACAFAAVLMSLTDAPDLMVAVKLRH